jgi:hypothetical protein
MASSTVICNMPSCDPDNHSGSKVGIRKLKKIKIDLSSMSCILNAKSENTENPLPIPQSETNNNDIGINNNNNNNINKNSTTGTNDEMEERDTVDGDNGKSGYYYRNRDKKIEYQKKYNREQGDKIKNYNKDYYQRRREEILEKAKTKIMCDCGCEVQLFNMNSHKKTKKHERALERALEKKQ